MELSLLLFLWRIRDCCKWILRTESFPKRLKFSTLAELIIIIISSSNTLPLKRSEIEEFYAWIPSTAFTRHFRRLWWPAFSFRTRRCYKVNSQAYQSIISCILSWAGWESLWDIHKFHLNSSMLTVTLLWPDTAHPARKMAVARANLSPFEI